MNSINDELGRLLSRKEMDKAGILPVSGRTARRLESDPVDPLPTVRIGHRVFYPENAVKQWMHRRISGHLASLERDAA